MNRDEVRVRTLTSLMGAGAVASIGFVAVVVVTTLLASEMTGSDGVAGIPVAAGTIGTALAASPLAARSKRKGRRPGLVLGYVIGAGGGALAFFAGQARIFWLFVVAMAIFGVGQASNLQGRFAAADLADEKTRARSIAWVVWMATIGGLVGSPLALWINRLGLEIGLEEWVAPHAVGVVGFIAAALVIGYFLRPDPLEVVGGLDPGHTAANPLRTLGTAFRAAWPRPGARLALIAMAVSQTAMVAVMTMTPLHMKDHGHGELSTLVIGIHVLGMFGFAPLIGRWADKRGRVRSIIVGSVVLGAGTVASVVAGYVPGLMFVGLFLLGLGWSFAVIGGAALLTESVPLQERVQVQGLADVLMTGSSAAAALASGFIKQGVGFHWLANLATISAVLILVAAVSMRRRTPELEAARSGP